MHGGKNWNLGGNPGNFSASPRTLFLLKYWTGQDHARLGLTQDEAYERLQTARALKRQQRLDRQRGLIRTRPREKVQEIENTALGDAYFWSVLRVAIESANEAGDAYKANHEPSYVIHDPATEIDEPVYGGLTIPRLVFAGKLTTPFGGWLVKEGLLCGKALLVSHRHAKTKGTALQKACLSAMLEAFRAAKITALEIR